MFQRTTDRARVARSPAPAQAWVRLSVGACLAAALMHAPSAMAQTADNFVVKRATELRMAPGDASASAGPLAAQTPVTRSAARQGAWVEVRTAQGGTGWVHMFDLTPAAGAGAANSGSGNAATGALRGLSNLFNRSPAQASSGGTSTVGIRGLSAEDLSRSQPNLNAVVQAEALRLSADQARTFAADAKLVTQAVEPLPAAPVPNR